MGCDETQASASDPVENYPKTAESNRYDSDVDADKTELVYYQKLFERSDEIDMETESDMAFYFYQPAKDGLEFPFKQEIADEMLHFLKANSLIVPPPLGYANGTIPGLMFNEICAFGFDPQDVERALSSYFCRDYLKMQSDPKDREKIQFVQRMQRHRDRVIQLLLLLLDDDKIPAYLGGRCTRFEAFTTLYKLLENESIYLPTIKAGERKPKPWRKVSLDTVGANASEEQSAIDLVTKTYLVSEPLIKYVVYACACSREISYLTSVTSVMPYRKGMPRVPPELKSEKKIENWARSIRDNEFRLIQTSGYDITVYNSERPREEQPYCYIGYEMWVVKISPEPLCGKEMTLYFHLQDIDDVALMGQGERMPDPPLIVDQNMWKFNLQFKGSYPLVPCYADLKSKYLSAYGKAVTLKYLYETLVNTPYNQQPIFAAILRLNDDQYMKDLARSERVIQLTLQKSTLNIKNYDKSELVGSFVLDIQKQIAQGRVRAQNQRFVPLSPLLFLYKKIDKTIPCEMSTMLNSASEPIMVEDKFKGYEQHGEVFGLAEIRLQERYHSYKRMVASKAQNATSFKQCPDQHKRILAQRDKKLYESFIPHREQLPIYKHKSEIYDVIVKNQFVVVTAETGSGKSSNLPYIIMELSDGCKILVTEPRRIAAMALAERVKQESGFANGRTIGYSVKGKAEYDENTIIQYCTIGVIVRRFVNDVGQLAQYSHIIIDEVHERDVSTDLFLCMLRNHFLLHGPGNMPKIIIMSATVDARVFGEYFGPENTAFFSVEGRLFKTTTHFLDELAEKQLVRPLRRVAYRGSWLDSDSELEDSTDQQIDDFTLNVDAVVSILSKCVYGDKSTRGNTLIFLPGLQEISRIISSLRACPILDSCEMLQCHSRLSPAEQRRLFAPCAHNRIICATNVAEASLTLPDIICVIDTGTERAVRYHPRQRRHVYQTQFISRQAAMQRAGRAGRVCEGHVYCTYRKSTFDRIFQASRAPEITRASLSSACLQLCLLAESYVDDALSVASQPQVFLQSVLSPPKPSVIQANLRELMSCGFIEAYGPEEARSIDERVMHPKTRFALTQLGQETAFLPIEPIYGRVLYAADLFKINASLAKHLVAVLSVGQTQVLRGMNDNCRRLAGGSDHYLLLRLFKRFISRQSLAEYDVDQQGLAAIRDTYEELDDRAYLAEMELTVPLLQIALWPNLAVFDPKQKALANVKNQHTFFKVHPSSACGGQRAKIVFYTEYLITAQNFLTTCSPGSYTALAYSAEETQTNFRASTVSFQGVEFRITGKNAAILISFIYAMKRYHVGYDIYKRLLYLEHGGK